MMHNEYFGEGGHRKIKGFFSVALVAVLFWFWLFVVIAEAETIKLTFETAVEAALKNNPEIRIAEAAVNRQKALKQKSVSAYMPRVDFYTDYLKGDAPSGALFTSIDKRKLQLPSDFNNPGDFKNVESGLKVRMQLFNGGKNILGHKAAEDMLQAALEGEKAVINRITADVMKSWFNVISSQRFISISEETLMTIRKQLKIMTVRYKGGSILKSDILSLKVRLAEAQEEVIRNKSRIGVAKASLAFLLGISPRKTIVVKQNEAAIRRFEKAIKKLNNDKGRGRPEIRQSKKYVSGAEKSAVMAKRNNLPTVQLMGKYYLDDEDMEYSRARENWTVGVMMNWNLFSGMSDMADKKKALADLVSAREEKRKADLFIALDSTRAFLQLDDAKARLEVSEKNRELAEESHALVKKQYEGGAATITRYLDAELALSNARTRFTTAQCDKMSALVETARAKGVFAAPALVLKKIRR